MQDKELYQQLLGLKQPWRVSEVEVDFEVHKVDLWVEWPKEEQASCPECKKQHIMVLSHFKWVTI